MKINLSLFFIFLFISSSTIAQDKSDPLPYKIIPEAPKKYTATAVAARMVDGLGFRYYWATEGLRPEDLSYKPSENARTTAETIDHIYGLSRVIVNATLKLPNVGGGNDVELSFEEKRRQTLLNIKKASDILKSSNGKAFDEFDMVFKRGDESTTYPYWNVINGPISDAIWHVGQVVSFRRASGNPFNSKVSVLRGKIRQ